MDKKPPQALVAAKPAAAPAPKSPVSAELAGAIAEDDQAAKDDEGDVATTSDPKPKTISNAELLHTYLVRSVNQTGRRRSGVSFGLEPIEIKSEDFSPRELDAILSDVQLIAEEQK